MLILRQVVICMFCNDTATTEFYTNSHTLSLHDTLPISPAECQEVRIWLSRYTPRSRARMRDWRLRRQSEARQEGLRCNSLPSPASSCGRTLPPEPLQQRHRYPAARRDIKFPLDRKSVV